MNKTIKATLTLNVEYDNTLASHSLCKTEIGGLLASVAEGAASNGLLSGESPLTVKSWGYKVQIQ